jgi:hypothetical protein
MSEMKPVELKPCPFCGGQVEMHYTGSSDWDVVCSTCPVETRFWVSGQKYGHGESEAAEARRRWNTRPALTDEQVREIAEKKLMAALYDDGIRDRYTREQVKAIALKVAESALREALGMGERG